MIKLPELVLVVFLFLHQDMHYSIMEKSALFFCFASKA